MKYVVERIGIPQGNAERHAYETIGSIAADALACPSVADLEDIIRDGAHSKYCPACLKVHRTDVNCF